MNIRIICFWMTLIFTAAFVNSLYAESSPESPPDSAGNVLADFSFEGGGKGWNIWGGTVGGVARSGRAGLTIRNAEVKWSGADQVVVLPEGTASVTVSGWIRAEEVVRGMETWENARISIEFRDGLGRLVGGYPPATGQAEGTTEWTHYVRSYNVSTAAKTVAVQCALGNALGTAHFDDIVLTIRDRKGGLLRQGRLPGIMDEGEWYVFKANPKATGSHYVDWSMLLDAPAGKHGFLTAKDGNLYFENGRPARFWGTNLVAKDCFASDAQIDSAVSRLAKMGANMLRLHHMDAPWTAPNIFGNAPGTRELSKESMRQLDYLIHRCKQKGIYIFLDFLVHRDFTEADGIENRPPDLGGKQVGLFSRKIIDLQKEYNEKLLTHVNQFTGIAYKDEPAIAASAFINESTVFGAFTGDILTPHYRKELEGLWEGWLLKNETVKPVSINLRLAKANPAGAGPAASKSAKTKSAKSGAVDRNPALSVSADNSPAVSTFTESTSAGSRSAGADGEGETFGFGKVESVEFTNLSPSLKKLAVFDLDWKDDRPRLKLRSGDGDVRETIKFLSELETGYFREMREHFRGVGGRYPLAGSNMPLPLLAMLKNNAELDIICSNDYWDHPQVWKIDNDWDRILEAPFHNRSQLRNLKASAIQNKAYYRVVNRPFIMTEWNHCYPNEYVLEGVPLIAAYGALQGWHGILQFDFNLQRLGADRIQNYKLSVQPEAVAQWVMAAPLFLRGDVQTAPGAVVEGILEDRYGDIPSYSEMLETNYHLPFVTRVAKRFDRELGSNIDQYDKYFDRESGVIRSETGELAVNGSKGFMRIDAPRVQGASGFIGGEKFDFPAFSCEISNRHASIYAVSADRANLTASKRFYLVVTGPAKMKGQVYDPARNQLENAGDGEVLMQVINGSVTFKKVGGKKLQIYPLEPDGARGKALPLKTVKKALGTFDLSAGRTLVYEVVAR